MIESSRESHRRQDGDRASACNRRVTLRVHGGRKCQVAISQQALNRQVNTAFAVGVELGFNRSVRFGQARNVSRFFSALMAATATIGVPAAVANCGRSLGCTGVGFCATGRNGR